MIQSKHLIRHLTPENHWRHCPGHLNPADLPSRGVSGDRLLNSTLWWEGPPFFCCLALRGSDDAAYQELVKNPPEITHVVAVHSKSAPTLEAVTDCKCYSSLTSLFRVTSYVFRIVKAFGQLNADNPDNQLRVDDLQHAEVSWICHILRSIHLSRNLSICGILVNHQHQFMCNNLDYI